MRTGSGKWECKGSDRLLEGSTQSGGMLVLETEGEKVKKSSELRDL